jgi:hypothetical protein
MIILTKLSVAPGVARQRIQRIILLLVGRPDVAIVVGRVARVYPSSGEYLSLALASGDELLTREALLLVIGPVLGLRQSCFADPKPPNRYLSNIRWKCIGNVS